MDSKRRRAILFLSAAGLLTGCHVHFGSLAPLFTSAKSITAQHVADSPVDVETHNGAIEISRADRADVEITATVKAETQQRADATTVSAERDGTGALVIRVAWPDDKRRSREECDLAISIPDATGVRLISHNGELSTRGLAGEADLQTHNGPILVEGHAGNVQALTHNGAVEIRDAAGTISAESHNGEIEIQAAPARVEARTQNGAIEVSLAGEGIGPITAESSNGAVTIEVGAGLQGRLAASTSNGGIELTGFAPESVVERQKGRVSLRVGGDEPLSTVQTHNGAITIRQKSP